MPKSVRKFIRREKARIRREVLDVKEQERLINESYKKIFERHKIGTNTNKTIVTKVLAEKHENKRDL